VRVRVRRKHFNVLVDVYRNTLFKREKESSTAFIFPYYIFLEWGLMGSITIIIIL